MRQLHIFFIALLSIYAHTASAQMHGRVGVGLRANPDGGGVVGKYFITPHLAAELQLNGSGGNYYDNGTSFMAVGLLTHHFELNNPQWRIFIGGGMHAGSWKRYGDAFARRNFAYGVDVIGGIEYLFPTVPIGISADVKPAMNFVSGVTSFPANTFGFGIRYYFSCTSGRQGKLKIKEDEDGLKVKGDVSLDREVEIDLTQAAEQ